MVVVIVFFQLQAHQCEVTILSFNINAIKHFKIEISQWIILMTK